MNTHFKVFASYNIIQYMCDFIHALIYICYCLKMPKKSQINKYSDSLVMNIVIFNFKNWSWDPLLFIF